MGSLTFEAFKRQWLKEVDAVSVSPTAKSLVFARKLFTQWRDLPENIDDLIEWSAPLDSGIDYIYSENFEEEEDPSQTSTILYLIQSKYGVRSSDSAAILSDGEKAVRTISQFLNSGTETVATVSGDLIKNLRKDSTSSSRVILILATENSFTQTERSQLDNIRTIGTNILGITFDVETISLETIFANVVDDSVSFLLKTKVMMEGNLTSSGENILVGSVALPNLYFFLRDYWNQS